MTMNTVRDKNKAALGVSKRGDTSFASKRRKLSESLPQDELSITQGDVNKEVKAVRKTRNNPNFK